MAKHPGVFRSVSIVLSREDYRSEKFAVRQQGVLLPYKTQNVVPSERGNISSDGVLFFGLPAESSASCWNTCEFDSTETIWLARLI